MLFTKATFCLGSVKLPPPKHQENESCAVRKQLFRKILLNIDAGILLGAWLFLMFCYCLLIYYVFRSPLARCPPFQNE